MDAGTYSLYSTPWPKDKAADGGFNRGDRVTFRLRRAGRSTSVLSNCNKKAGDGNARRRTAGANFMELIKFRILNFRSINDSGEITVDRLTSLVGRNESGKSNLLLALATLTQPVDESRSTRSRIFRAGAALRSAPMTRPSWRRAGSFRPPKQMQSPRLWAAMAVPLPRRKLHVRMGRPLGSGWQLLGRPPQKKK